MYLPSTLRLLPLASLLLCGSLLTPSAWAEGDKMPVGSNELTEKNQKKKKNKKKKKKSKKKAQAAAAAKTAPVKTLLPGEAARELERFNEEVMCIVHSALSPEEKHAAVRSLFPKAAPIAAAAREAGGVSALLKLQEEQDTERMQLFKQLEEQHQVTIDELLDRPELLPAELRSYVQERKQLCARYKLDYKKGYGHGGLGPLEKEAKAFILACYGIPVEAQKAAVDATPQQINTATVEWVQTVLDILNSEQTPIEKAEAICRNNQNYNRYLLALQNDRELYANTVALLQANQELRQKENALGVIHLGLQQSNYGGCMPLKCAMGTYFYLRTSNFRGF